MCTHHGIRIAGIGIAAMCSLVSSAAVGAPPTHAELVAWLRKGMAGVPDSALTNITLKTRTTTFPTMLPTDMAALEAEVAGKPDHPKRMLLERAQELAAHPYVQTELLFLKSLQEMRSTQFFGERAEYVNAVDVVVDTSIAWQAGGSNGGQLTIVDPRETNARGYEFALHIPRMTRDRLGDALTGGLSTMSRVGGNPAIDVADTGNGWEATISMQRWTWRVRGLWHSAPAIPQVTEKEVTQAPDAFAKAVGEVVRYEGWHATGNGRAWFPERVDTFLPGSRLAQRFEVQEVGELSPEEWKKVSALPVQGTTDPVSGRPAPSNVVDFRGNEALKSQHAVGGTPQLSVTGQGPSPAGYWRWRLVGWGAAGAIVVVLVVGRLRGWWRGA